ncbi:MAG: hypothetical protein RL563_1358, partial [Pseudomonadota bacterium]
MMTTNTNTMLDFSVYGETSISSTPDLVELRQQRLVKHIHPPISWLQPELNATTNDIIIADGSAPEIIELLQDAKFPALFIKHQQSPLVSISHALSGLQLDTLHIVAHGRPGAFCINGQWIDAQALEEHASLLAKWNVKRIALWSCYSGADGGAFSETLSKITGTVVNSSSTVLGYSIEEKRPLWTLNISSASRDLSEKNIIQPPFKKHILDNVSFSLARVAFSDVVKSTAQTYTETTQNFGGAFINGATDISFTSNPPDLARGSSGNNIIGTLQYKSGGVINEI